MQNVAFSSLIPVTHSHCYAPFVTSLPCWLFPSNCKHVWRFHIHDFIGSFSFIFDLSLLRSLNTLFSMGKPQPLLTLPTCSAQHLPGTNQCIINLDFTTSTPFSCALTCPAWYQLFWFLSFYFLYTLITEHIHLTPSASASSHFSFYSTSQGNVRLEMQISSSCHHLKDLCILQICLLGKFIS